MSIRANTQQNKLGIKSIMCFYYKQAKLFPQEVAR